MKHIILPAMLGVAPLLGALPLPAATQVATYAEAQQKKLVSDDGYIILAYPKGWNRFGEKRGKALLASEAVRRAAGKAVLIPLPIPEYTTDETKAQIAATCGELKVPNANSYPAFLMLDREGRHYATLCGASVVRGKDGEIADRLGQLMAKGRERSRLLAEAEKAKGPEKARLTFDAYQIDGLTGFGKGFGGHIAKMDPKDSTGANRAANYNHYGLIDKLTKGDLTEGLAEVDKMLADSAYTNRQKQQMCVAAIGVLRRKAGPAGAQDMQRYAKRMLELAPDTPEGKTAAHILREWVRPLRYEEGWMPDTIPTDQNPVELVGKLPFAGAGSYTVRFDYTKGKQGLTILAVELYDGNKKVAEDRHQGVAGGKPKNNSYTLRVNQALKDPHLFISVDMKKRDSYGTITISQP